MHHISEIKDYHAHVYFDAKTVETARNICNTCAEMFGVEMGRVHERPVGPHPMWSCQLAATPEQFSKLLPWLTLNRRGLVVFAHPQTGDDLTDHRDRGIWLGAGLELDLSVF